MNGNFNHHLWQFQQDLGWWFWMPFVGYGIAGLVTLYRLAPAQSHMGRVIRWLLSLAFISMIAIPQFNGLGSYAFHLVTIAVVLINYQMYLACKAAGKIAPKPTAETFMGRTVERLTERSNGAD